MVAIRAAPATNYLEPLIFAYTIQPLHSGSHNESQPIAPASLAVGFADRQTYRKILAASQPSSLQYILPTRTQHPLTKTVYTQSAAGFGLPCSFNHFESAPRKNRGQYPRRDGKYFTDKQKLYDGNACPVKSTGCFPSYGFCGIEYAFPNCLWYDDLNGSRPIARRDILPGGVALR